MTRCNCRCGCTVNRNGTLVDWDGVTVCRQCFEGNHGCACRAIERNTDKKRIAIIANDTMKGECQKFCFANAKRLEKYEIWSTNGTGKILDGVRKFTGSKLTLLKLGHAEKGDRTAAHLVDHHFFSAVFFFIDPYDKHHDDEKRSLMNACLSIGVPFATIAESAEAVLKMLEIENKDEIISESFGR